MGATYCVTCLSRGTASNRTGRKVGMLFTVERPELSISQKRIEDGDVVIGNPSLSLYSLGLGSLSRPLSRNDAKSHANSHISRVRRLAKAKNRLQLDRLSQKK